MAFIERFVPHRRSMIVAIHVALITLAYALAYLLRFEAWFPPDQGRRFLQTLPLLLLIRLIVFYRFHLSESLWRYVGMQDVVTILKAVTLGSLVFSTTILMGFGRSFPKSVLFLDWLLCLALVGGVRLAIRALREYRRVGQPRQKKALVVGAGDAGEMLVREIQRNPGSDYDVVGFVDDDPKKQGRRIHGIEVVGGIDRLPILCRTLEVRELLIAIPSATGAEVRRIVGACRAARVSFKTLPSLRELMENPSSFSKVRRVNIEDLLRRQPVRIETAEVEKFLRGKRVLVTGAGGSIGSELCRQVARFSPHSLVMLDRAENGLFFVEMELRDKIPGIALHPVIGDVTDESRMGVIFEKHRPQVVFHAAAHKHVPLMEANKTEAVKNNVSGIMVVAKAADRAGVEDFVMISTDKAVRPTSVMGATKRLAEMYVQALNTRSNTRFTTVRFGNVLASEGSVLQIFQRQIEAGGPVTVTHPDMMRYFMTIPEASQLVLQAATQGKGGEIFVLDMGEPVHIVDLAHDLIVLSGLEPEKDIGIKFTGPRPGEKLFEELLNSETRVLPTSHEKIMVVETDPVDLEKIEAEIKTLLKSAEVDDEAGLLRKLTALVPGYVNGESLASKRHEGVERILIVENDSYTRTALKRMLQAHYVILEADNPRDALKHARESRPNLVIVNFHLPRANIGKLCARIREEAAAGRNSEDLALLSTIRSTPRVQDGPAAVKSRFPIILLVDSRDTVSSEQLRALGADNRIYNPLPVSIVEKRVRDLLADSSMHGEPVSPASGT
jgi:FlaA1/EpsC-like NDP-sugar epimerase/DNA-binding NarL/FixJ family response regulator